MTCLISTKRKEEDGSYSVLCTCLSCGSKLYKTKYLSQKALKQRIKELRSELEQELDATARTVVAGFSPAKPFQSYRKNKERLQRIAALPQKIKKDKK